jgi:hypothetical protein
LVAVRVGVGVAVPVAAVTVGVPAPKREILCVSKDIGAYNYSLIVLVEL